MAARKVSAFDSAFDLTDLDNFRDGFPHEFFTQLRAEAPVYWHDATSHTPDDEGFWVLSRHGDVVDAFRDPVTFSSETGGSRPFGGTFLADMAMAGKMLNMMDDPRHRRIRNLVNRGMTPRVIADLEPELRRRARAILQSQGDSGECDFVVEVARELPLQAICMLLGVPQERRTELCEWVDTGLEFQGRNLGESTDASREANTNLASFGQSLIEQKRANPADDMLSTVIHASLEDEEPSALTTEELLFFYLLLFTAGSETTRKAIAGGLRELVAAPEQLAALREDASLWPTAVDEILRWTTSSVYKRRTATRDVELRGQKILAGQKVTLWEMSANRDDRVFEDPFQFDVARDPNPHVAFGWGVHRCLGANLARLEIRVMLEEVLARWDEIEVTGPPVWNRDNRLFGLKHLPVRFGGRS
jgi:cytochrome P450